MGNESKIKIDNLNLHIGKNHILKNIHVSIPERQLTVILGPSGCGKTTLLKSLNRLTDLYPEMKIDGSIFLNEEDILHSKTEITLLRKKMGLLSQSPYPLPMSIYDNIAYGLRISGRRKKKYLIKRVEHYLTQVSLWDEVKDRLKDSASSLSIGQQQRLCLARGLAVDPEIILADEPTSALDPLSSKQIEELFVKLKQRYTIVVVTHILRQARRIADYVIFMYMGEVIEHGPAKDFFENPKEELTKEYLKGAFN
ncbi:MAG: phosphate ABC transporter ATP-binding protein [Bacteroidetes bacterium GWC2_33_15]|nr:MAG: phosphate ABC transporter ATP-binding protein [Bacteroidetes bacterium GWA2_33_15]OFX51863.1 MAG: phosphate ABC transporter ATP-binding protein [Bacteroidetes bacterium GWC2_33_15]OFX63431.1 MAG: phosphate ABC transporter ATP-binding protein [Bacteroidetes bacterium GWB2_32_14]OFX67221.1 MAG: phosphate ABC transporter ATP-binding protein [Bacteroidetes bacterium GWD2_33_33]HAN17053.1 phosphate ABC transporter ATP-binding protein [Bacteroidales bacterium]